MSQDFTGSFPSDILTPDAQALLFEDTDVQLMTNIYNGTEQQLTENFDNFDAKMYENFFMVAPNVLVDEEYPGPHEFEVCICPNTGSKNPWVYSPKLNKVFMDMNIPFPVDFKIKSRPPNTDLFVRATPAFTLPQHSQDCVYRCMSHEYFNDASNKDTTLQQRQHVIRCKNSMATYVGDRSKGDRLSVVVPLTVPQMGMDSVREMYMFVCKNSCPNPGMNRRPIEVIFTLEDINGTILGRKALEVRICSCPKRDKEKEEKEHMAKGNPPPKGKKRKLDKPEMERSDKKISIGSGHSDTREYELKIPIIGKQNVIKVLSNCQDIMGAQIFKHPHNEALYKKCLNEIQQILNKLSQE